jgi:hypothetical protein
LTTDKNAKTGRQIFGTLSKDTMFIHKYFLKKKSAKMLKMRSVREIKLTLIKRKMRQAA